MVNFTHPIPYHLNVGQGNGQVCIGLLKADQWKAENKIITVLHAISVALSDPEVNSFVDDDVNYNYHHNKTLYEQKARKSVK